MPYIAKPIERDQATISTLDSMVEWDSTARVIDHFIECLDLGKPALKKWGRTMRVGHPTPPKAC